MSFEALEIPPFHEIAHFRGGRSPREGYQRGGCLKFFGPTEKIAEQPDFKEAISLARGRSIVGENRLMNLYLLIRFYLPRLQPGSIVEFGSYRGGSALFMARLASIHLPGAQVFGLDTFEGMPETDKSVDAHSKGDFSDTLHSEVESARVAAGLDNLRFVKVLFQDTEAAYTAGPIALAHIDCDIYSAAAFAYDAIKPKMVPGGYVVFDDATESSCIGATEAVESLLVRRDGLLSEQIYPHFVFRYPPL